MKKITGFISILNKVVDMNPRLTHEEMNLVTPSITKKI